MKRTLFIPKCALLLLGAALLLSCSRATNPDIERGSTYQFRDGYPEVRMTALGVLDPEDRGQISVAADIVDGSLIYREEDGVNRATVEIEIRVVGLEGTYFADTFTTMLEVDRDDPNIFMSQDLVHYRREIEVGPGDYEVTVSVQDLSSGNRTTRQAFTFVPDPEDNEVRLTSVQLMAKQSDRADVGYQPVTTYDVSTVNDSIRFVVQVTNIRSEDPLQVRSRLIRCDSDTTASRPMSFNNYSPSSIQYKGIDFNRREVVDQTFRSLEQPGSVLIEFRYALPQRGNYRFEVRAGDGDTDELFKARDFAVFGQNYPALRTPRELAEPLVYLMGSREYEALMAIEDEEELKEAIDRFWLSNIGSMSQARHVISLYYERVEEANKQFTNFKEGWKTDVGMIYILFGPPWYVERRLNWMLWSYTYDRDDPRYNYHFNRPRGQSEFFPFNNYLLQRDSGYFNIQYQQMQRWLTGQILQRSI